MSVPATVIWPLRFTAPPLVSPSMVTALSVMVTFSLYRVAICGSGDRCLDRGEGATNTAKVDIENGHRGFSL
jgi:hypothetical protein